MTFNFVLLAFGLAALSAMVPLQSNAIEAFDQGFISGDRLIVDSKKVYVILATGKKAEFGNPSADLNLLPDAVTLKAWADYPIDDTTLVGEKDYVQYGYYDFHAAVLYAWRGKNIKPSFWHFYDCQFKQIAKVTGQVFLDEGLVEVWDFVSFIRGAVDKDDCYGPIYVATGTCPIYCPAAATKSVYASSVGKGILIKSTSALDAKDLKLRIANFGPVLVPGSGAAGTAEPFRLYYGWEGNTFRYITRDATTGVIRRDSGSIGTITKAYIAYSNGDCDNIANLKKNRYTRLECDCPPVADAASYKADKRVTKKFCAAGSTRADWAVVATVLLLPLLSML